MNDESLNRRLARLCVRPSLLVTHLMFAICVHASEASIGSIDVDESAPLPRGWREPWPGKRGDQGAGDIKLRSVPLWGVPAFHEPSATHCARPPSLSEALGQAPLQHPSRVIDRERIVSSTGAPAFAKGTEATSPDVGETRADSVRAAASPRPAPTAKLAEARETSSSAGEHPGRRATLRESPLTDQRGPREEGRVTAGMVDDNADFAAYLNFQAKHRDPLLRNRALAERYRVVVRDRAGSPVPDAELALTWHGAEEAVRWARTDGAGHAWLHPKAVLSPQQSGGLQRLQVLARHGDGAVVRTTLTRGQTSPVVLTMDDVELAKRRAATPLDLVFLVDATGSMGDEIDKLRNSMQSIAERIGALQGGVDLCFGLVAYRDMGDEFLTRSWSLTQDLPAFQRVLGGLRANGGGDEPEALNEALDRAVHRTDWRGAGTSRLVVLVGDAPPQMNRGAPYYDQTSAVALARGIKVHAVGASGLNRRGEATFRSIAQATGGRFVFLTYKDARRPSRGPGSETTHDVRDYSVSTLDDLIVRLVREEVESRMGS